MVSPTAFRPSALFLILLLATAATPIWGQLSLRQIRAYQIDRPDTAFFYSAATEDFSPYFSATLYAGMRYSRPIRRLSLGVRSSYSHLNKWFLFSNLEYARGLSLEFPDGVAGFNGSAVWAKSYKRTLKPGQATINLSRSTDRINYLMTYESERQKFSTWRIGLSQEANPRGGYNVDESPSKVLGYRYQALRVGMGKVTTESIVYQLKRNEGKTSQVEMGTTYLDVLIPLASQIRYYNDVPPNILEDPINFAPGVEVGALWNKSRQGVKSNHTSIDIFAGIHGVYYPNALAFYIGLRASSIGTARHGKNPHQFAVK